VIRARQMGKDQEELDISPEQKRVAAVAIALLLLIGCSVLIACTSSGQAGSEEGPGMLYFYAEW
jgi:hypothetical protein